MSAVDIAEPVPGLRFGIDDEPGLRRRGIRRFRYVDDLNDYLREATRIDATAKTFRTWNATLYAARELASRPAPASRREARATSTAVIRAVAAELNNTPAVCRRSYVHPAILERYQAGTLGHAWKAANARGSARLEPDERRLLVLLDDG